MEAEYKNMARRELQALCKQHGLPANLTNARMAENLASLLQKRNSEEMKPKGCLKGSGGSSGEDAGRGRPVIKKVSFHLQEEDVEQDGDRRDPDVRASPERRRSSRRRSIADPAPIEAREAALEAKVNFEVRTRSKRHRSPAVTVVWSPVIEEEARNQNNDPDLDVKCARQDEDNRRKVDNEYVNDVPTTRSLRSRVVTVGGNEALLGDLKPRRMETRRNAKNKQGKVHAPVSDVSLGAEEVGKDESFANKACPKRTRGNVSTVEMYKQQGSMVPQIEAPPLRRSKRNLVTSHKLGSQESGPTLVVSVPYVKNPGKAAAETEEAAKLYWPSNQARQHASKVKEVNLEISLPASWEAKDAHPKKEPQTKIRKRNAHLVISQPDVVLTETAADDVRTGKLSGVEEPCGRSTRSSSVLNVVEHETSLPSCYKLGCDDEAVRKNKNGKHDRNKKTRKEANGNTAASCETGAALAELTVPENSKRVAHSREVLRRSMRNVARLASTKHDILVTLVKSSVINEANKENKLPKRPEHQTAVNTIVDVAEKAKRAHRLQKEWDSDEPVIVDSTADSQVEVENEILEGHKHFEEPQRKSSHNSSRRRSVILADKTVVKIRPKRRKTATVLEEDFSIAKIEIGERSDSAKLQQENVSSNEYKEKLCEKSCEKVLDNGAVPGMCSSDLVMILTEEVPNFDVYDNATKKLASNEKQSSRLHEKCGKRKENVEHQIEEDKNCLSKGVEPVSFDLLDTYRTTYYIDGFHDSAQHFPSTNLSVVAQNAVSEIGSSSHSGLKRINQFQHSLSIDSLINDQYHTDQLVESGKFSEVEALQGNLCCVATDSILNNACDNLTEMVTENKECFPYNLVEVPSSLKDGCSYVEVVMKADNAAVGAEGSGFANLADMNSTMDGANYSEDGDGQYKETNVVNAPFPSNHPEEHSRAVDTRASSLSHARTAAMLVNVHGVGEVASYTPICLCDKDEAVLPLTVVPDNDLVGLLDQQKIFRVEIGSFGADSVALLNAESACKEFNGLKELNETNMYSDDPRLCEAAEEEGKYEILSSNLLVNTSKHGFESCGDRNEEHSDGKLGQSLESNAFVLDFYLSVIGQGDEIVVPNQGNQNSSFNASVSSSCNSVTKYDSSDQIVEQRDLSPLKVVEICSYIKETPLEANDVSRSSFGGNLYQNHEKVVSPCVDSIKQEEHTKASGLKINYGEYSHSDDVNVLSGISVSLSEMPVDTIVNTFVQVEDVKEVPGEGKLYVDNKATTSLQVGSNFEKQLEVQEVEFQVMQLESSAFSVVSRKNGPSLDALPCVDDSEKNDRMKRVGTPSSTGCTLQFKDKETESSKLEGLPDARASCDQINDFSPAHPLKSVGTGTMDASNMYKESSNGKSLDVSSKKMWNTHLDNHANVLTDNRDNHISNGCSPSSKNCSEGGYQSNNLEVSESERETWVNSANINNPNSVPEVTNKLEEITMQDPQLLSGSPLSVVFSAGKNSCISKDEFRGVKKAYLCEPAGENDEDSSDRRPFPILEENNNVNDGDKTISCKSENSAVVESQNLEFQSPFSNRLREAKDFEVYHDGVKNGVLDASYGFSSSGHEHVEFLCRESAAHTNEFDGQPVQNLDVPMTSQGTCGLCDEFQASSDIGETSADSAGRLEKIIPSGSVASLVKDESTKFEEKILSLEDLGSACVDEGFLLYSVNVEKSNERYMSEVLMQEAGWRVFEGNGADETKDMEEKMELELDINVHEEDEQEHLMTLRIESDNHTRNSVTIKPRISSQANFKDEKHTVSRSSYVMPMDPLEFTASCQAIHSCERISVAEQHEADISCVASRIENNCANNYNHNTTRGNLTSGTLFTVESESVKSEHILDSSNPSMSDVAQEATEHNLDSCQPPIPEVAQEAVDTVLPEVGEVSLIPRHSESEENSTTDATSYIGFEKIDCENNDFHYPKECNINSDENLEAKHDEDALHQQLDGADHKEEISEYLDASQLKPDLRRVEEADCDNNGGSNLSHNVNKHDEDNISAPERSDDGLWKLDGLKKTLDVNQGSKPEVVWVAPGANLMFLEDLFHMETKQSLLVMKDIAQVVVTAHESAEENFQHEYEYSGGRSGALNMVEKMEMLSFMSDGNDTKENDEQATFTATSSDFKVNLDGTIESENSVRFEASFLCSDSKAMVGLENPASMPILEERSLIETNTANEDEERNSVECLQTVLKNYIASGRNLNDEGFEVSDMVDYKDESGRYVKELETTTAAEAWIEDLAVTGNLVSSPGASVTENCNGICQMGKADEVTTGKTNDPFQTKERDLDVAADASVAVDTYTELESRRVLGTPGDTVALTDKQVASNSIDAELVKISKARVQEKFNSAHSIASQHVLFSDRSNPACGISANDGALEPPELSKANGQEWMDEISRKLLDFRVSSAKRTSKPGVQGTPMWLKHDFANGSLMGKENTPGGRTDCPYKRHADGSETRSARRPLQDINHKEECGRFQ